MPKITKNFEVKTRIRIPSSGYRYCIFGNHINAQAGQIDFEINSGSVSNNKARFYHCTYGSGYTEDLFSSNSLTVNSFNDLVFKSNGSTTQTINVNGTNTTGNLGGYTTESSSNQTGLLFVDRALRFSELRSLDIASFQIYENGILIKDFVPAYRKSDNVIGMVEKVSKTFYTNKGSGTFSKGGNIPR